MGLKQYSLIIIGGGPIGLTCALAAQKAGLKYLILEKGTLVNSLCNYPVNMTFFSTSERLEIGNVPFITNNPKPTRSDALEYYRRVTADNKIQINLFEEVLSVKKVELNGNQSYEVLSSKQTYQAKSIIIATGFYDLPYLLNVPGEELTKVKHYYDDPHFYAFQKVIVVGASNSAVDAALETWRKGALVTMMVRGSEIGQRVKYWVRPDIDNRINEGSIKAYFDSHVIAIRENSVDVKTPDGIVTLANDWVLAMTGYQPDLSFLQRLGIQLSADEARRPIINMDTHETNLPNIYLAGVICGGMNTSSLFIENSREHANKIIASIQRKPKN